MMDRNYPNSSFADPLAPPAQTVAWAYERSTASIKPSASYGATHLESELLHRQTYACTQLPTYTTTHHPTGLSGGFDSGTNTTETSVMNFLSAMESRALQQAGPVGASLLPPFRTTTWQTGANPATELFLTGALPTSATFPYPAPLSSYQHPGAFPSRSYATTPSLALQDHAFSTSTNGLLSSHLDPLLQLKPSQATLPTSLAFDRLPTPSLGAALPPQSSTYRSAQESAPHLLQPQFGLLPLATQSAPQPYGVPIFSGSIERALQRECSVIKHHQRPSSSSHAVSEQLPGLQHSLQGYLGSGSGEGDGSFQQDPSRQTPVPCSTSMGTDSSQGVNGAQQPKTGVQSQAYPSSIPSPSGYCSSSTGAKTKDCSSKLAPDGGQGHPQSQGGSPESYPSPGQGPGLKQGSVIASQQNQPYTSAPLPSLLSTLSHSQSYITSQAYSSSSSDLLRPSLYKTLPSFSGHSGNVASVSQSLVYCSSPGQSQDDVGQYGAQVQGLCLGNPSQSSPASHSQGAPNVSYLSQGQASVTQSQSYAAGQSLSAPYPSASAQRLPTSISGQGYTPFSSAPPLALQNNCRSSVQDLKPAYCKLKLEGEIPIEDLQALQQVSLETSSLGGSDNVVYVVSKMDDRYNTQSVIRSNSRAEDQLMGPKTRTNAQLMSSHEELKQHSLLLKGPEPRQQNHQANAQSALNHTQNHYIRVPNSQVLLESDRDQQMVLIQQPLIHCGLNPSKVQLTPGSGQVPVQYLHMEGDHLISVSLNGSQSQPGPVGQNTITDSSILHLSSPKDPYSQSTNQQQSQDAKHHFALSSICFPESMLLADERNILSNVDDILAATAAACGVTPQDFVKATSGAAEGDMADPKGHFQTGDTRHQSPSFSSSSSQTSIITNTNSHNTMTLNLNGSPMTSDGHQFPKAEGHLGQQYSMSHSHTTVVNPRHDMGADKGLLRKPGDEPINISPKGQSVYPSNRADGNPNGGHSENEYHLSGLGYDPSGNLNRGKANKHNPKGPKVIKREDGLDECPSGFVNPKKRVRPKALAKPPVPEEDNIQPRKKTVQAKRQNSRGSDPTSSPSTSEAVYDSYQQQERMRQKIREVEEQQPEVKTGFIGSFLDFLKSGPKQHFSSPPVRTPSRSRKPSASSKRPLCAIPPLPLKIQPPSAPLIGDEGLGVAGSSQQQQKCLEEELQKNLETLPSFSSDEDESSAGKNQALQNSISSALSALDEPSDRTHKADNRLSNSFLKPDQAPSMPHSVSKAQEQQTAAPKESSTTSSSSSGREGAKPAPPGQLAVQLTSVAIEGLTDEELSDSGGEGMYRERDEFVVKNEDTGSLKVTLTAGQEPPAIWKVQKALLQKFVPELRDRKRVFSATNSYLGYFGDAKTMYRRVYVKFLDTVNKKEYVRVCNRKPRCKPMSSMRGSQAKTLLGLKTPPRSVNSDPLATPTSQKSQSKPRAKQPKTKAEPPPKKRRKWKEEYSESSPEDEAEDDEFTPPVPFSSRFLNTRTMKETFKSFVELLISVALDADVMSALERENDELLLPHMKRVDGMIWDNRRRLLPRLRVGQLFKTALDSFPEISVVTELKKDGETPAFKVRLSGKAYNRKNMKPSRSPSKLPLEYTVDQQKPQWFSLYHSLQHYKYHTYLMCKDEIASLRVQAGDMGQEQTVQLCMRNGAWVEGLFDRFGELLNQVQQACL